MQGGGERVDVRPGSIAVGVRGVLLRRRVAALEDQRRDELGMLLDLEAGGAEVEQDGRAVGGADHDVVGRDVEMPGAVGMHQLERAQQRRGYEIQFLLRGRAVEPLQPFLQRAAPDEIEQHVGRVVLLEDAPDADDVAVTELRQQARLVVELLEAPAVVALAVGLGGEANAGPLANDQVLGEELFQREVLLQRLVVDQIGDAEPAAAEHARDHVLIDLRARRQRRGVLVGHRAGSETVRGRLRQKCATALRFTMRRGPGGAAGGGRVSMLLARICSLGRMRDDNPGPRVERCVSAA